MRTLGTMHPTDNPVAPDYVLTLVVTVASSARVFDWPAGTKYAVFGRDVATMFVNYGSTAAAYPTSSPTTPATTGSSACLEVNPTIRAIPGGSTGGSIISPTTGFVTIGCYGP